MGLLIPMGEGHEANPDFTVPIANGFVGSFELEPRGDGKTTVVEHSWHTNEDGFETTGTLQLNGGRLKQTLRVISSGSQAVIYEDHVTALSNVTVRIERGVPVGVENDEITGGTRMVFGGNGHNEFIWQKPRQTVAVPGAWANVDGRPGVVMASGGNMAYAQASGDSPGISVCADILYGSYSDRVRHFKAGEEVAHRVAIFLVEATPKETAALAQSCKLEARPGGQVLRFKQAGGREIEVAL
jgi:hypothetical protein